MSTCLLSPAGTATTLDRISASDDDDEDEDQDQGDDDDIDDDDDNDQDENYCDSNCKLRRH